MKYVSAMSQLIRWPWVELGAFGTASYRGQSLRTCSIVWIGSPHWQATCSGVCWGKNRWVNAPTKA